MIAQSIDEQVTCSFASSFLPFFLRSDGAKNRWKKPVVVVASVAVVVANVVVGVVVAAFSIRRRRPLHKDEELKVFVVSLPHTN